MILKLMELAMEDKVKIDLEIEKNADYEDRKV